jgi:hypothetical protein
MCSILGGSVGTFKTQFASALKYSGEINYKGEQPQLEV